MTVPSEASSVDYAGNDTTYVFPFTFNIVDSSHLVVTLTDSDGNISILVEGANYIVTLPTVPGPGSITRIRFEGPTQYNYPVPSGSSIRIERVVPTTQSYSFRNQRQIRVEAIEQSFDYLTYIDQQQQRYIDDNNAALVADVSALDARITIIEDILPSGVPVSAAMQPVVAATPLATARSLMGITDISTAMQPVVTALTLPMAREAMGTTEEAIAMAILFG